jgi:hypothetical protein
MAMAETADADKRFISSNEIGVVEMRTNSEDDSVAYCRKGLDIATFERFVDGLLSGPGAVVAFLEKSIEILVDGDYTGTHVGGEVPSSPAVPLSLEKVSDPEKRSSQEVLLEVDESWTIVSTNKPAQSGLGVKKHRRSKSFQTSAAAVKPIKAEMARPILPQPIASTGHLTLENETTLANEALVPSPETNDSSKSNRWELVAPEIMVNERPPPHEGEEVPAQSTLKEANKTPRFFDDGAIDTIQEPSARPTLMRRRSLLAAAASFTVPSCDPANKFVSASTSVYLRSNVDGLTTNDSPDGSVSDAPISSKVPEFVAELFSASIPLSDYAATLRRLEAEEKLRQAEMKALLPFLATLSRKERDSKVAAARSAKAQAAKEYAEAEKKEIKRLATAARVRQAVASSAAAAVDMSSAPTLADVAVKRPLEASAFPPLAQPASSKWRYSWMAPVSAMSRMKRPSFGFSSREKNILGRPDFVAQGFPAPLDREVAPFQMKPDHVGEMRLQVSDETKTTNHKTMPMRRRSLLVAAATAMDSNIIRPSLVVSASKPSPWKKLLFSPVVAKSNELELGSMMVAATISDTPPHTLFGIASLVEPNTVDRELERFSDASGARSFHLSNLDGVTYDSPNLTNSSSGRSSIGSVEWHPRHWLGVGPQLCYGVSLEAWDLVTVKCAGNCSEDAEIQTYDLPAAILSSGCGLRVDEIFAQLLRIRLDPLNKGVISFVNLKVGGCRKRGRTTQQREGNKAKGGTARSNAFRVFMNSHAIIL